MAATHPATHVMTSNLEDRLAAHILWLESFGHEGVQLEIVGEDLRGVDLSRRDLCESVLYQCTLDGAKPGSNGGLELRAKRRGTWGILLFSCGMILTTICLMGLSVMLRW